MSTDNTMTVMVNPYRRDLNRVWAVKIDDTSFPYAVYPSGHFAPETEVRHWRVVEVPIPAEMFKDGDVVNSRRPFDLLVPEVDRAESIESGMCSKPPLGCGQSVKGFDDEFSVREYQISGMCQVCQDKVFAEVG